jgi:hypothetical protein
MHEDRVTQELIGELYLRYMRGELTLDAAAEQIFALWHAHGEASFLAVTFDELDPGSRAHHSSVRPDEGGSCACAG